MGLIQYEDYRIKGYQKKPTIDANGDLVIVEYFKDYDETTKQYSNLKVKETRVYTRDSSTLLMKRDMTIQWFSGGKETAVVTTQKFYTAEQGYSANKRARQNLINRASMYLLSEVGLTDGKTFLNGVTGEISTYVDGSIQPLVDAIANSTEPFMTLTIKGTLDTILNVTYGN